MKNLKYIYISLGILAFTACNDPIDVDLNPVVMAEELPALSAGSADFSNYVALGNSLTAGFTDGALFQASQTLSLPNLLSQKFSLVGGGNFVQPLTSDNFGGLALAGTRIQDPRLVFGGAGPVPLESVIGSVTVSTDIALNNPTGPFNNLGVPGAKSFHLLAPGYGNISNVQLGLANPYFVRMTGSTPDISVLQMAASQAPSFFSLWIGNNDVLGYATSGGDGTNPITPVSGVPGVGFDGSYGALIATLTAGGAKGVVANIPNVVDIPHFTTVPHNPVPLDAATAAAVNGAYAAYNGGLQAAFAALAGTGLLTQEEVDARTISFVAGAGNAVVIEDETLTNLGAINPAFAALPQIRQATAADLLVLPASSFIGTLAVPGNPLSVNGVAIPLADKWVLLPSEQEEIAVATAAFNQIIATAASQAGLALVDANSLLNQLANGGITSGDFTLTSNLVMGSAFSLDGVHPTARGYSLLANEFMKAIDVTYGSNFEASGNLLNVGDYPTNYSPALQ
ncbi:SGNH/GDSL hydrolase family protein [Maribacter hydrothermalis]|uniref:G-D-S-L family lipolytic protein n=1 Tax=Maribacter hydrothermalis TaxID=1836467 RepID=A0A1B7Z3T4_9FLAO|nr:G-D-S-L family lipolytic protein [Maribacter hydrothermalis]APQ17087.1 G-D-S-L family lipolytic protein [Maribacter hydrothermalis]OBR37348.1 G-D-S-L family lipolytic protein [Maribacter hydrothermalis]